MQVDKWPASMRWSREYLAKALGGRKIVAGGYHFSFEDYLAYIDNSRRAWLAHAPSGYLRCLIFLPWHRH